MEKQVNLNDFYRKKYMTYQKKENFVQDLNPVVKLNILLAIGIICVLLTDFKWRLAICALYYVIAFAGKKFRSFGLLFTGLAISFLAFLSVIRQLSVEGSHVLFSIFGWKWTMEGWESALDMTMTLCGFSGAVILFFTLTEMRDLMYALEKKGVSHVTSYVILASMQTITDLKKTSQTIMDSQRARGVETEGNLLVRVKALVPVISPLFLSALTSAEEKAISMDARAFSVKRDHTFLRELQPAPIYEVILAVIVDLCLIALIGMKITGRLG